MKGERCTRKSEIGSFRCPYPAAEDHHRCLFHLPPVDRVDRNITPDDHQELAEQVSKPEGTLLLFDAGVETLDLSEIDTNTLNEILLFNCRITELTLPESPVKPKITIARSEIVKLNGEHRIYESDIAIVSTTIKECVFSASEFNDLFQIQAGRITHFAEFGYCGFNGLFFLSQPEEEEIGRNRPVNWEHDSEQAKYETVFECTTNFSTTEFHEYARFTGVTFERGAHFDNANFYSTASFVGAELNLFANFRLADFEGVTDFRKVQFGYAAFEEVTFADTANFEKAEFCSDLHRLAGQFEDSIAEIDIPRVYHLHLLNSAVGTDWDLNMNEAEFDGALLLTEVSFQQKICLKRTDIEQLRLDAKPVDEGVVFIDFAHIKRGDILIYEDLVPGVTVENSKIGNVSIDGENGINPLRSVSFRNTQFEDFNFGNHRTFLRDLNYDLMETTQNLEYDLTDCEKQIANARTSARRQADDQSASQFFIREKRYRRGVYDEKIGSEAGVEKLRVGINYLINHALDKLCKYGESSQRLLGWAIVAIFGYATLYLIAGAPVNHDFASTAEHNIPGTVVEPLSYFIFSVEIFSTMLLSTPEVDNPLIRLLAASQGFLGSLFIALLVFTLTKSLHR